MIEEGRPVKATEEAAAQYWHACSMFLESSRNVPNSTLSTVSAVLGVAMAIRYSSAQNRAEPPELDVETVIQEQEGASACVTASIESKAGRGPEVGLL
jgi:hypothetical protein